MEAPLLPGAFSPHSLLEPFNSTHFGPVSFVKAALRRFSPSEEALFVVERGQRNLARIGLTLWLALLTHAAHVVAFVATRPLIEPASVARWRGTIIASHGVVALVDALLVLALRRGAHSTSMARHVPLAFVSAYLALGAVLAGADQAVTTDVSPWFVSVIAMVLLVRVDAGPMLASLGFGYALYLAYQHQVQPDAAVRLSNSVKGLSITALGLGLAMVFGRSERREFRQRRLIERQRAGLEAALADANRAAAVADEANRARATFLATISHEIRTPMTGVLGVTDLLAYTSLDANQRQLLQTVQESGHTLLALINDLLDLSKAEAGHLSVETVPVDVAREVDNVARLFEPKARAKGLTLEARWLGERPPLLRGDPLRLRQVMSNLVTNALKFTARGGVEVRCRAEATGARRALTLEVVDTGSGISAEAQTRLFVPYAQGDASVARAYGGTGLGLAIARQLAEAMGGSLVVESALGKGSTFRFCVALDEAPPGEEAPRPPTPSKLPARMHSGRVLVVDDNAVNQLVSREMLRQMGFEVEVAGDGAGALALLEVRGFDVMITDLQMPGIDGVELLRRLRGAEAPGRRLPVVVLSAGVTDEERRACVEAGADAIVAKPVGLAELEATLRVVSRA